MAGGRLRILVTDAEIGEGGSSRSRKAVWCNQLLFALRRLGLWCGRSCRSIRSRVCSCLLQSTCQGRKGRTSGEDILEGVITRPETPTVGLGGGRRNNIDASMMFAMRMRVMVHSDLVSSPFHIYPLSSLCSISSLPSPLICPPRVDRCPLSIKEGREQRRRTYGADDSTRPY